MADTCDSRGALYLNVCIRSCAHEVVLLRMVTTTNHPHLHFAFLNENSFGMGPACAYSTRTIPVISGTRVGIQISPRGMRPIGRGCPWLALHVDVLGTTLDHDLLVIICHSKSTANETSLARVSTLAANHRRRRLSTSVVLLLTAVLRSECARNRHICRLIEFLNLLSDPSSTHETILFFILLEKRRPILG